MTGEDVYEILFIHKGEVIKLLNTDEKIYKNNLKIIRKNAEVVFNGITTDDEDLKAVL